MYEEEANEGEQSRTHTILLYRLKRYHQRFLVAKWEFLQSWDWREWQLDFYRFDVFAGFTLSCFGPGEYEVRIPMQRDFVTVLKFRSRGESESQFDIMENDWPRIWDE